MGLIYSPPAGGGTTNTGNAAVGDVASGKTFSSSVLTNATGTSTKNATVPNDVPILPAQAYVDASLDSVYYEYLPKLWDIFTNNPVILSNKGLTHFEADVLYDNTAFANASTYLSVNALIGSGATTLDFSGNALPVADVNKLLLRFRQAFDAGLPGSWTIDLSGGTNATPTGQGITDKAALITAGWTVTTN